MSHSIQPNMSRPFQVFLAAFCGALLLAAPLRAQVGNDNPTGVSGVYNGNVSTAGSYDPYTGNATRSVTDLSVAGGVGAYPLAFTRTMNSRYTSGAANGQLGASGSWRHSYEWSIEPVVLQKSDATKWTAMPAVYTVNYSDARRMSFSAANGDSYFRGGPGISDRFQQLSGPDGGDCLLLLPDGGKVWFQAEVDREIVEGTLTVTSTFTFKLIGIIDPYGQLTTVADLGDGCLTVTEPAGRTLKLFYIHTPWNGDVVIDRVVASDGRSVKYNYGPYQPAGATVYTSLVNVQYLDTNGASFVQAIYAYQPNNVASNGRPLLSWAIDPMYTGPMWAISYTFVPYAAGGIYGQLQSENYLDPTTGNPGPAVSILSVNGNSRTETRGDGFSRTFNYSGGQLVNYTDFKGQSASLSHDVNGYVNARIDRRQNQTDIANAPLTGAPTQITFPLTPPDTVRSTVQYEYGSASCPDPNNRDGNNPYYLYRVTNEAGYSTIYLRDANKRVVQINYSDGTYETFSYNGFGQVLTHKLTTGGTESFAYDGRGLKTTSTAPLGHVTHYYYYQSGPNMDRLQVVTDARDNSTAFEYNARGQVTHLQHQDYTYVQGGYNVDGTLAWFYDELGHMTTYTYDEYKRVLTATNPLGETTTTSYALDWVNPLVHTTNDPKYVNTPNGKNIIFDYDANFRRIDQVVALGTADEAWTLFQHDPVGNLIKTTDSRFYETGFGYDQRNRKIWMDSPIASDRNSSGHTMNWIYDGVGNKIKEIRADDAFQSWEYDIPNRITRSIDWRMSTSDPALTTTKTRDLPDANSQITIEHVVDAKNAEYRFEIDAAGRKIKETFPPDESNNTARFVYWHYDAAGNVDQYYNPAGNIKTMSYDNRNRLVNSWWSRGSDTSPTFSGTTLTYTYDLAGRMTSIVTGVNETTVAFGYDDANRKIWEDQTVAGYPTRGVVTPCDADGNREKLEVYTYGALNYGAYYDYDQRNRLRHIYWDSDETPWFTYTYDAAGNVTKRQDSVAGVNDSTNIPSTSYDGLNRPTLWEETRVGDAWFARSHYQYDKVGREVATWRDEDAGQGERFSYDPTNQITNVSYRADQVWTGSAVNPQKTQSYLYTADKLNLQSVTENGVVANYSTNGMNQITQWSGQAIGNDANFNFASISGWQYGYDAENHLTSLGNPGPRAAFVYDGLGRCVKRTIDGVTTVITYDGWKAIMEWSSPTQLVAWTAYGPGPDEILWRWQSGKGHLRYHSDRHGNVTALLDFGGNVIERYRYDAFGKPTILSPNNTELSASAYGNRFLFQGREYFREIGLYDYRHRFYDPFIGRFIQADPLGFGGGDANLFRYCGGDPINNTDPSGETPIFHAGPRGGYFTYTINPGELSTARTGGYMGRSQECASGCQAWSGAPDTHDSNGNPVWAQGAPVSARTAIGTVVATGFLDGFYPSLSAAETRRIYGANAIINHVVFFLGYENGKMLVLQQWKGYPASVDLIPAAGFFEVRVAANQGNAGPGAGGRGAGESLPSANPIGVGETTFWTWQDWAGGWVPRAQPVGPSGQNYGLGTIPSIGGGQAYRTPGYQGGFAMATEVNLPGGGGPYNPYNSAEK